MAAQAALVGTSPIDGVDGRWEPEFGSSEPELRPSNEKLAL
jgi:hypothetical protein